MLEALPRPQPFFGAALVAGAAMMVPAQLCHLRGPVPCAARQFSPAGLDCDGQGDGVLSHCALSHPQAPLPRALTRRCRRRCPVAPCLLPSWPGAHCRHGQEPSAIATLLISPRAEWGVTCNSAQLYGARGHCLTRNTCSLRWPLWCRCRSRRCDDGVLLQCLLSHAIREARCHLSLAIFPQALIAALKVVASCNAVLLAMLSRSLTSAAACRHHRAPAAVLF